MRGISIHVWTAADAGELAGGSRVGPFLKLKLCVFVYIYTFRQLLSFTDCQTPGSSSWTDVVERSGFLLPLGFTAAAWRVGAAGWWPWLTVTLTHVAASGSAQQHGWLEAWTHHTAASIILLRRKETITLLSFASVVRSAPANCSQQKQSPPPPKHRRGAH